MPLYNARCNKCQKIHEYVARVDDRDQSPICCEEKTERVLLKGPIGFVDNPAFMKKYGKLY